MKVLYEVIPEMSDILRSLDFHAGDQEPIDLPDLLVGSIDRRRLE